VTICTLAAYRRMTGDLITYDADVVQTLADAQAEIERLTGRFFEQAAVTETLEILDGYRVFPSRYPVTAVTAPAGALTDDGIGIYVGPQNNDVATGFGALAGGGYGGYVGTGNFVAYTGAPTVPLTLNTATVSYTGGFATIPIDLQRINAEMAMIMLYPESPANRQTNADESDTEGLAYPVMATLADWPKSVKRKLKVWSHIKTRF
jgi:hypothetical protein